MIGMLQLLGTMYGLVSVVTSTPPTVRPRPAAASSGSTRGQAEGGAEAGALHGVDDLAHVLAAGEHAGARRRDALAAGEADRA
ncbi:hypothetical protein GCM10020219_077800 [Nonomuraea dietziae]